MHPLPSQTQHRNQERITIGASTRSPSQPAQAFTQPAVLCPFPRSINRSLARCSASASSLRRQRRRTLTHTHSLSLSPFHSPHHSQRSRHPFSHPHLLTNYTPSTWPARPPSPCHPFRTVRTASPTTFPVHPTYVHRYTHTPSTLLILHCPARSYRPSRCFCAVRQSKPAFVHHHLASTAHVEPYSEPLCTDLPARRRVTANTLVCRRSASPPILATLPQRTRIPLLSLSLLPFPLSSSPLIHHGGQHALRQPVRVRHRPALDLRRVPVSFV